MDTLYSMYCGVKFLSSGCSVNKAAIELFSVVKGEYCLSLSLPSPLIGVLLKASVLVGLQMKLFKKSRRIPGMIKA